MRVYLAGPMRGHPKFNFPTFYKAAKRLRAKGFDVFSPAERDRDFYGTAYSETNATGSEEQAIRHFKLDPRCVFAADTNWICLSAEGIVMLPGWKSSRGAIAERALAIALGLKVLYLDDDLNLIEDPLDG